MSMDRTLSSFRPGYCWSIRSSRSPRSSWITCKPPLIICVVCVTKKPVMSEPVLICWSSLCLQGPPGPKGAKGSAVSVSLKAAFFWKQQQVSSCRYRWSMSFFLPPQGQTGPKGETGTPGPPGPPVSQHTWLPSECYNLHSYPMTGIYLSIFRLSTPGTSRRCHPPTPHPVLHEGQNSQKHRRQPGDGRRGHGRQLQGLRRRHGGDLRLPQLPQAGDRADEAPAGHTGQPSSYLQGPAALPPWFPRWFVLQSIWKMRREVFCLILRLCRF